MGTQLPQKGHSRQLSAHVCCGQTAGWIKVSLGTEVGLGPVDIVLDENTAPHTKRGTAPPPHFSAHVYCDQTVAHLSNSQLGPGYIVLDGNPAPPEGAQPTIFGPCLLWPNGWMDQGVTWYGSRPRPSRHCVGWEHSSPHEKGHSTPHTFRPMSIVAKRSPISATAELLFDIDF